MTEELVRNALESFARGDVDGAVNLWREVLARRPGGPQVRALLASVRAKRPELAARLESVTKAELAAAQWATEAKFSEVAELASAEPSVAPPTPVASSSAAPLSPSPSMSSVVVPLPPIPTWIPEISSPLASTPAPSTPSPLGSPSAPSAPSLSGRPSWPGALPGFVPPLTPASAPGSQSLPSFNVVDNVVDPWQGARSSADTPCTVNSTGPGLGMLRNRSEQSAPAEPAPVPITQLEKRLQEFLGLDNYTGAFDTAQEILKQDPRHAEAARAATLSRVKLTDTYRAKLGSMRAVPQVKATPGQVIWLDLDHRAGFVLAQIDGVSCLEEILDIIGMDPFVTLRILCDLLRHGIIDVGTQK